MKNRLPLLLLSLASLLLASLAILSCDSANPVAPTGSTLTVTANPTLIALNSTSTITVTGFRPDGNPLNPGTLINVSSTIGRLDDALLEIQNGRAVTTLHPDGRIGTATVTASLATSGGGGGGEGGGGGGSASVDVQIGASEETKPTLIINANPDTVSLNQTSTISFQARNADDSSYGSGGRIRVRTSLGTLDDRNLVTDADGEAETTLRPGSEVGTATVTATVEESDEVTVDVQFGTTAENRPTLTLTASPDAINVEGCAEITATARNADGSILQSGTVTFTRTDGSFFRDSNCSSSSESNRSLTNGQAIVYLGGIESTATIAGRVNTSDETTTTVTFLRTVLTVSANPETVDAFSPSDDFPNPSEANQSTITVQIRDERNNRLTGPYDVELTASFGDIESVPPTENGSTSATYTAGSRPGTDTIRAATDNADTAMTTITVRDAPASFTFTVNRNDVPSGGGSVTMTASVVNNDGLALSGVLVRFDSEVGGDFDPSQSVTTNSSGSASTTITYSESSLPAVGTKFKVTATVRIAGVDSTMEEEIEVQ